MKENWSSYGNSYLRYLEELEHSGNSLSISTLSEQELQRAWVAILKYVKHTSTGKVKIEIHRGTISITIENSKEMSS